MKKEKKEEKKNVPPLNASRVLAHRKVTDLIINLFFQGNFS